MSEMEDYRVFTKPAELQKAINTLRGIVSGISSDRNVSQDEITELAHWCEIHANLRDRHPFSELLPIVEDALADGVITDDESKDILWVCNSFVDRGTFYDATTSSIQFLQGLIHGIMADGELSNLEIHSLKKWIDANDFLNGSYPFDEICAMLYTILEDGVITQDEREQLTGFLSNVIDFTSSYNLNEKDFSQLREKYGIMGICAAFPDIVFQGKLFCFTGESHRAKREEITALVARLGGALRSSVTTRTDYLVVGNAGNPCWAYACYGRKIEDAMAIRKSGGRVVIVNEIDFWDALDDAMAKIEK